MDKKDSHRIAEELTFRVQQDSSGLGKGLVAVKASDRLDLLLDVHVDVLNRLLPPENGSPLRGYRLQLQKSVSPTGW